MKIKRIKQAHIDKAAASALSQSLGITPLLADALTARGLTGIEEAAAFLGEGAELSPPETIKDMDKAVDRIRQALDGFERICIYGDYDADGVCATALLMLYLTDSGANARYYIPVREEGYGLNKKALDALREDEVSLIVTVDNGIVSLEEVAYAKSLGMDVIVTDHHQPKETLPDAVAVVDPHRQDCPSTFKHLCGTGVAFKLVAALEECGYEMMLDNYADLVAVATIGDIVPLVGENRLLVKSGLERLKMTDHMGLDALMELLQLGFRPLNARTVAFSIVPRINAAGRLSQAELALKLLLATDYDEATALAQELNDNNIRRQSIEAGIQADIHRELRQHPRMLNDSVLVMAKEGWHHGVIGISASKVVERYSKPCFLFEIKNDRAVGSGRGVAGISLFELLCSCDDLLIKYGGHAGAAGLTLLPENLEPLRKRFNQYVNANCPVMPVDEILVDLVVTPEDLTVENVKSLGWMEPCGCENEPVVCMMKDCLIEAAYPIGDNKHLKLKVRCGGQSAYILLFGISREGFPYRIGDRLDFVVHAEVGVYNGEENVSIKADFMRLSDFNENLFSRSLYAYDRLMRLDQITPEELSLVTPDRNDLAGLYRFLRANPGYRFGYDILAERLGCNYARVRIGILVLKERKLITITRTEECDILDIVPGAQKVDWEQSAILHKLRKLQ